MNFLKTNPFNLPETSFLTQQIRKKQLRQTNKVAHDASITGNLNELLKLMLTEQAKLHIQGSLTQSKDPEWPCWSFAQVFS